MSGLQIPNHTSPLQKHRDQLEEEEEHIEHEQYVHPHRQLQQQELQREPSNLSQQHSVDTAAAAALERSEWAVPRWAMCVFFWLGDGLAFSGVILLIMGSHKGQIFYSVGLALIGIGFCLVIVAVVVCVRACCIIRARYAIKHLNDDDLDQSTVDDFHRSQSVSSNLRGSAVLVHTPAVDKVKGIEDSDAESSVDYMRAVRSSSGNMNGGLPPPWPADHNHVPPSPGAYHREVLRQRSLDNSSSPAAAVVTSLANMQLLRDPVASPHRSPYDDRVIVVEPSHVTRPPTTPDLSANYGRYRVASAAASPLPASPASSRQITFKLEKNGIHSTTVSNTQHSVNRSLSSKDVTVEVDGSVANSSTSDLTSVSARANNPPVNYSNSVPMSPLHRQSHLLPGYQGYQSQISSGSERQVPHPSPIGVPIKRVLDVAVASEEQVLADSGETSFGTNGRRLTIDADVDDDMYQRRNGPASVSLQGSGNNSSRAAAGLLTTNSNVSVLNSNLNANQTLAAAAGGGGGSASDGGVDFFQRIPRVRLLPAGPSGGSGAHPKLGGQLYVQTAKYPELSDIDEEREGSLRDIAAGSESTYASLPRSKRAEQLAGHYVGRVQTPSSTTADDSSNQQHHARQMARSVSMMGHRTIINALPRGNVIDNQVLGTLPTEPVIVTSPRTRVTVLAPHFPMVPLHLTHSMASSKGSDRSSNRSSSKLSPKPEIQQYSF